MKLHHRPIFIAFCGILCFCLGAWLRFHAVDVATATLKKGIDFTNMGSTIADSARANAIYDIATPLLWVGGALTMLAAVVLLIPVWRDRLAGVSPQGARIQPL